MPASAKPIGDAVSPEIRSAQGRYRAARRRHSADSPEVIQLHTEMVVRTLVGRLVTTLAGLPLTPDQQLRLLRAVMTAETLDSKEEDETSS